MHKYLALFIALALAACGASTVKTVPGVGAGDYRIAQFIVVPAPGLAPGSLNGTPMEVAQFKELLQPLILQQMPALGAGKKPVGMTITVRSIHPAIDPALAAAIGNGAQVWTEVTLWDPASKATLGTLPLSVTGNTTSGTLGAGTHDTTLDRNMQNLAQVYMNKLTQALYPAKS